MASSLLTLPIEMVYRILDNLDNKTILLSCRNVCTRLNDITDTYYRYKVIIDFLLWSSIPLIFRARVGWWVRVRVEIRFHALCQLCRLWLFSHYFGNKINFRKANRIHWIHSSILIKPFIHYLPQTFTTLDLSAETIDPQGMKHLAIALEQNKVTLLHIRFNL
jgi:hypothetical protein